MRQARQQLPHIRTRAQLHHGQSTRAPPAGRPSGVPTEQLSLLPARPKLLDDLASLDIDAMTPLEALTKLYEIKERARGTTDGGTD